MTLFALAAALTACLSYSSRTVIGADPKATLQRPLALSGKALVDGCEVTGRLIRKDDGVYAVLDCSNTTDKDTTVQFNYAVHCTPASSPFMRMLPMPSMIHQKRFDCRIAGRERKQTEILVKKEDRPAAEKPKDVVAQVAVLPNPPGLNPESWSLAISREEVKGAPGWGGSAPAAANNPRGTVLDKGVCVLARTLEDNVTGAS